METLPERVGRYEILSLIGRGAMGVVYRARDPLIGREVALKRVSLSELLPEDQREEFKERFFREARAAGNLRHPNIVTIYDVGESEGIPYMAMEYLSGGSLSTFMKAGPLPLDRAVEVALQVAQGLHYAHVRGIVHRDVKPDNILLDAEGKAVLTDFGAAHLQSSELTRTGEVLGTPHYMSPEQILGEALDGRSDLFSLGVVLYLMVTGRRPFKGDTISAICYHIVHSAPEPFPEGSRVPPEIQPVLARLLAKKPADRFATGDEAARAMEALRGASVEASGPASMTQTLCVPTPTPRPGTVPAPPPPRPAEGRAAPPPPHAPPAGSRMGLWLGLLALFAFLTVVGLAVGIFLAHRIEVRSSGAPAAPGVAAPPGTPDGVSPGPSEPAAVPADVRSPRTEEPPVQLPVAPQPKPIPPAPKEAPKPLASPARPAASVPPSAPAPAPAPDPAVLASCDALARDAARASELARARDFTGACVLTDAFPQRIQSIDQAAGPLERERLASARTSAEEASRVLQQELLNWARPVISKAQATYEEATDGLDDEDEIIVSYVQMAPVLRWKERLPKEVRAELDAFVNQVRDDLDDDEWERAQAQARGGSSK